MKMDNFNIMMKISMIAPCGMNCTICKSQFKEPKTCAGCNTESNNKPKYCSVCKIRICSRRPKGDKYCFKCDIFPCVRLKLLDKRYRARYGMSMIENQLYIQRHGIRGFVKSEQKKWVCPRCGKTLCVHKENCVFCSSIRSMNRYSGTTDN